MTLTEFGIVGCAGVLIFLGAAMILDGLVQALNRYLSGRRK